MYERYYRYGYRARLEWKALTLMLNLHTGCTLFESSQPAPAEGYRITQLKEHVTENSVVHIPAAISFASKVGMVGYAP